MPSLATVYGAWRRHLKNNINATASYSFNKNGTKTHTMTSIYIVGDYKNATECFISGHGGLYDDNYYFDNKSFKVPKGVTVKFYQTHGATLSFSTNALRLKAGKPMSDPTATDLTYVDDDDCPNYILSKDQGRHLGDFTPQQVDDWKMTYEGAQEVCGELDVVMVLVRNRWFHAGVTLKSAISDVRSVAKNITTFNCLFCRVHDNSDGSDWNARTGVSS